jgi:hypothetical protein
MSCTAPTSGSVKDLHRKKTGNIGPLFFEAPGPQNTVAVIQVVKQRLGRGDIEKVLVASESGRLALRVRKQLPAACVVCVTYDKETRKGYRKPALKKDELLGKRVTIVERSEPIGRGLVFRNWWERKTLRLAGSMADLFWMTLICVGGHGFRTAVEIVFMSVEAGIVKVGEKVVSLAGTGWGADSAIVMSGSKFEDVVGEVAAKRMKVEEILAMPKRTVWAGYG